MVLHHAKRAELSLATRGMPRRRTLQCSTHSYTTIEGGQVERGGGSLLARRTLDATDVLAGSTRRAS